MARLFLATLLSEANFSSLDKMRDTVTKLASLNPESLRWTTDAKLHLTWLFVGNFDEKRLAEIQMSMRGFADRQDNGVDIPVLNFDQAEIWHADGLPRHLVLTPSSIPDQFERMVTQIRHSFLPFVEAVFLRQAQRAPRPHVTIAHFKKHKSEELATIFSPPLDNHPLQNSDPSLARLPLPVAFENTLTLRLNSLSLIESSNAGGTNHYRTIESVALGSLSAL